MSSNAPNGMNFRKSSFFFLYPDHPIRQSANLTVFNPDSYQEMITHLALNSHPDPQRVLVIGGGDGGVLREVVKHSTVKTAVLCDIDEAVIRLSKKYLPGMSIGFQHPNVSVHVGDGFKFLADRKNEFDVIITDSSDPEGPAESLFQKPYFELLFGALREGGVVTTQGCSSPSLIPRLYPSITLPPSQVRDPHG
jgi:spermidine synthase